MFGKPKNKEFKPWHLVVLVIVIVAGLGFKLYYAWHVQSAWVKIGGETLQVRVADTADLRFRGWSKYKDMGDFGGMMFIFPERGQHTMVMRNMMFPLDIVWIDGSKIVDIAPNLAPDKGQTEAELTPYFARAPSSWVLEVPAGFAQAHSLKVGDSVEIVRLRIN